MKINEARKRRSKLRLHRETLRRIDTPELRRAHGATGSHAEDCSNYMECNSNDCTQPCGPMPV